MTEFFESPQSQWGTPCCDEKTTRDSVDEVAASSQDCALSKEERIRFPPNNDVNKMKERKDEGEAKGLAQLSPPELSENRKAVDTMVDRVAVSTAEKTRLHKLFLQYEAQFSNGLKTAGAAMVHPHSIRLRTNEPIYTPQYRRSKAEEDIIEKETQKLAAGGVIRPSWSPYNSPVLVVRKKDGSWRSVIDYWKINSFTIKEPYPIPRADQAFDALSKARYMLTFDFTSGYWQLLLWEEDKQKTAFTSKSSRWEYKVLPMGITNAAPTFQRNMEIMLQGLLWKSCIIYIDDVIVFSDSFDDHLRHLEKVLQRMKRFNIITKPAKCVLCQEEVRYLGHIVGKSCIRPDNCNIKKLKKASVPTTVKEIRAFVGLASYYCWFIHQFADIAKPLTNLQKKDATKGLTRIIKPG